MKLYTGAKEHLFLIAEKVFNDTFKDVKFNDCYNRESFFKYVKDGITIANCHFKESEITMVAEGYPSKLIELNHWHYEHVCLIVPTDKARQ